MTTLEAHTAFAQRDPFTGRSALQLDATLDGGPDCWPACATAACAIAGGLEDAQNDDDLDELLEHFESLVSMGVKDDSDLEAETMNVLGELMRWGDSEAGRAMLDCAA